MKILLSTLTVILHLRFDWALAKLVLTEIIHNNHSHEWLTQ